jgi:hypothetical protein
MSDARPYGGQDGLAGFATPLGAEVGQYQATDVLGMLGGNVEGDLRA